MKPYELKEFEHKKLPITLKEIADTGMSIIYKDNFGKEISSFYIHGNNQFKQTAGYPINGMDQERKVKEVTK